MDKSTHTKKSTCTLKMIPLELRRKVYICEKILQMNWDGSKPDLLLAAEIDSELYLELNQEYNAMNGILTTWYDIKGTFRYTVHNPESLEMITKKCIIPLPSQNLRSIHHAPLMNTNGIQEPSLDANHKLMIDLRNCKNIESISFSERYSTRSLYQGRRYYPDFVSHYDSLQMQITMAAHPYKMVIKGPPDFEVLFDAMVKSEERLSASRFQPKLFSSIVGNVFVSPHPVLGDQSREKGAVKRPH